MLVVFDDSPTDKSEAKGLESPNWLKWLVILVVTAGDQPKIHGGSWMFQQYRLLDCPQKTIQLDIHPRCW